MSIQIYRLNKKNPMPKYMSKGASGMDLYASLEHPVTIMPGEYSCVPSGIIISLPEGLEAQIRPRSGLAAKHGITVLNTPGTVDSDYRGEIKVILVNHGKKLFTVKNGMRIAQMVISKVERVQIIEAAEKTELAATRRDDGGFGHTGLN
jgi:dUTP pyrophosphatase